VQLLEFLDRYGLDGRDANSCNGIFWVLGRYDRPSAPARPVFGTILYMCSQNTARKFSVKNYIKKYDGKAKQASLKDEKMPRNSIEPAVGNDYKTQSGETLAELTATSPVLLVFLRHFG